MYLDKKNADAAQPDDLFKGHDELNRRQRDILLHAIRHPGTKYTIQSHTDLSNVTYGTARADLLGLTVRGLMDQEKRGKSIIFTLSADVGEQLKQK